VQAPAEPLGAAALLNACLDRIHEVTMNPPADEGEFETETWPLLASRGLEAKVGGSARPKSFSHHTKPAGPSHFHCWRQSLWRFSRLHCCSPHFQAAPGYFSVRDL